MQVAMLSKGLSCKLYKSLGGSALTNQNLVFDYHPLPYHTQPIRLMRLGSKANAELHHLHMKALIWRGGWACHGILKKRSSLQPLCCYVNFSARSGWSKWKYIQENKGNLRNFQAFYFQVGEGSTWVVFDKRNARLLCCSSRLSKLVGWQMEAGQVWWMLPRSKHDKTSMMFRKK